MKGLHSIPREVPPHMPWFVEKETCPVCGNRLNNFPDHRDCIESVYGKYRNIWFCECVESSCIYERPGYERAWHLFTDAGEASRNLVCPNCKKGIHLS